MAADSLTAHAPDTPASLDHAGPCWQEELRSNVYWAAAHGLTRLLIRAAARRGDLQSRLMLAPASGSQLWELLLVTDPPDHTRYRKLVARVFTVRAVEQLRVRAEAIAHELLDALAPSAPVDLVSSYCARLPVTVISEILGVPPGQRNLVLELGTRAAPSLDFGLSLRQFRTVARGLCLWQGSRPRSTC